MRKCICVFIFILFSYSSFAQSDSSLISIKSVQFDGYQEEDTIQAVPNTAYKTGEYLKYNVRYGVVKGGEAELSVDLFPAGYTYVYHLKAIARTAGIADQFFTIRDVYESYTDVITKLPIKAVRNIQEKQYLSYNEVLFKREEKKVVSLKSGEHVVPDSILDILSAFYYARSFLFKHVIAKDQIIYLNTYFDDELLPIKIKFRKRDRIKTSFGKLNCLLFVPVIEEGGAFKKEKDMQIWISDDGNFLPVKIKANLAVSSLYCELNEYAGLRNELNFVRKGKKGKKNRK